MSRVRYETAYWVTRTPKSRQPSYPRQRGPASADVVIVGGGLTGCLCAFLFQRAGHSVVLLEGAKIGRGATMAGVPALRADLPTDLISLHQQFGLRAARRMFEMSRRAALDFAALLRRLRVRCDLESDDMIRVAVGDGEATRLRKEYEARVAAGLDVSWLPEGKVAREVGIEADAAVRVRGESTVDPYRLVTSLAALARREGAEIYEASPVRRIKVVGKGVEVDTGRGPVSGRVVVVATGLPGTLIRQLRRHFKALDTYTVVTPPLSDARIKYPPRSVVVRDSAEPPHACLRTKDGRIIFQGADQETVPARLRAKVIMQRTGQLMYELSRFYPAVSGIPPEFGWSATLGLSHDGVMVAGPHRNFPRHLFALGLGHAGLEAPYLAARILLRAFEEQPEKGDELFGFMR